MTTYTPPKLISRAPSVVEPKGKGTVVVQVMVRANGTFQVMRVLTSTNPGDNAAALDIAKHSKYAPARRNGKPVSNFYDFSVSFGENVVSGAAGQIDKLLHAQQWADAKSTATTALAQNPSDSLVQAQLGVADAFTHDIAGAVAAFDRAGTVPAQYQNVAMQAYALEAQSLLKSSPKEAMVDAQKAVSLGVDYSAYYALGLAQQANGDVSGAQISLEKARAMAAAAKPPADTATRVGIDEALLGIATARKDSSEAADLSAEINALDPGMSGKMRAYSYDQQGTALQNKGDYQAAVKAFEQAAAADPKWAGPIDYTKAAIADVSMAIPNYLAAKSDTDKATAIDPNYAVAYFVEAVAMWRDARMSGNDNMAQDADLYARKAADLARKQGNKSLAEAADYFAQNHALRSNLEQWSTQLTCVNNTPCQ